MGERLLILENPDQKTLLEIIRDAPILRKTLSINMARLAPEHGFGDVSWYAEQDILLGLVAVLKYSRNGDDWVIDSFELNELADRHRRSYGPPLDKMFKPGQRRYQHVESGMEKAFENLPRTIECLMQTGWVMTQFEIGGGEGHGPYSYDRTYPGKLVFPVKDNQIQVPTLGIVTPSDLTGDELNDLREYFGNIPGTNPIPK